MTLQERVREIGVRELARKTRISAPHVCLISHGKRNPSLEVAQRLAKALKISTDTLVRLIEQERAA